MSVSSMASIQLVEAKQIGVFSPFDGRLVGSVPCLDAAAVPGLLERARIGVRECGNASSPSRAFLRTPPGVWSLSLMHSPS